MPGFLLHLVYILLLGLPVLSCQQGVSRIPATLLVVYYFSCSASSCDANSQGDAHTLCMPASDRHCKGLSNNEQCMLATKSGYAVCSSSASPPAVLYGSCTHLRILRIMWPFISAPQLKRKPASGVLTCPASVEGGEVQDSGDLKEVRRTKRTQKCDL